MHVEVIRSARRRKTVEAKIVDGVMRIAIPATMSKTEEAHWVDVMSQRLGRRDRSERFDVARRADQLSAEYGLPTAERIEWSSRQTTIWGSCTPSSRSVRISTTVADFPAWVVDYVIVHELAHLAEPRHDGAFWDLVGRYPLAERARGYLIAKSDPGLQRNGT